MTVFGIDTSHHQPADINWAALRNQGIRFVYAKITQGATFADPAWHTTRLRARTAGLKLAGYHYLTSTTPVEAQVTNLLQNIGDPRIPVVLDVEAQFDDKGGKISDPTIDDARKFVEFVDTVGPVRGVTMLYLPRWHWRTHGSPSLDGLPPLIQSNYGDDKPGTPEELYPGDKSDRWDYDSQPVTILQYGQNGRVGGLDPVDLDAYRGEVKDLDRWFMPAIPEKTMTAVSKVTQHTAATDSNGEVTLNGEIPSGWSDYTGAVATMNTADGWTGQVRRIGTQNTLIVRTFRRKSDGTVEQPSGIQVTFTLALYGQS